jgi:hypothetical protein
MRRGVRSAKMSEDSVTGKFASVTQEIQNKRARPENTDSNIFFLLFNMSDILPQVVRLLDPIDAYRLCLVNKSSRLSTRPLLVQLGKPVLLLWCRCQPCGSKFNVHLCTQRRGNPFMKCDGIDTIVHSTANARLNNFNLRLKKCDLVAFRPWSDDNVRRCHLQLKESVETTWIEATDKRGITFTDSAVFLSIAPDLAWGVRVGVSEIILRGSGALFCGAVCWSHECLRRMEEEERAIDARIEQLFS